jgi:hypothetical protein
VCLTYDKSKRTKKDGIMNNQTNYVLSKRYDLKGKKENSIIQVIFILIALIMVFIYLRLEQERSSLNGFIITAMVIGSMLVYMALHELTHGLTISMVSKTKSTYRIRFPFLTTGTKAYLSKPAFMLVCLMPSVIFGVLLGFLLPFLNSDYFIVIYVVLSLNFAGSSGDYYQVYLALTTKGQAWFKDDGETTEVYIKESVNH